MTSSSARPDTHSPPVLSWKNLALPNEHGGWGLLFEPALLGLWLAPSLAGLGFALSALLAFLARHPLRLALSDRLRGRRYPRTALAERMALVSLAGAAAALALAFWRAPLSALAPLLAAAPLGVVQLVYDARLRSRELLPELCGGVALGATAAAIVSASGFTPATAGALWAVLGLRVIGCVPYVRARLLASRGMLAPARPVLAAHVGALLVVVALGAAGLVPWLAGVAMAILLARAVLGLRAGAPKLTPRVIGLRELGFGALTVLLLGAGYALRV